MGQWQAIKPTICHHTHIFEVFDPLTFWDSNWKILIEDILNRQRHISHFHELILPNSQLKNYGLYEIDQILQQYGKSLKDYR